MRSKTAGSEFLRWKKRRPFGRPKRGARKGGGGREEDDGKEKAFPLPSINQTKEGGGWGTTHCFCLYSLCNWPFLPALIPFSHFVRSKGMVVSSLPFVLFALTPNQSVCVFGRGGGRPMWSFGWLVAVGDRPFAICQGLRGLSFTTKVGQKQGGERRGTNECC
jgi:hypothetical protein